MYIYVRCMHVRLTVAQVADEGVRVVGRVVKTGLCNYRQQTRVTC